MSDYLITLDDNTYELSQQQYGIPQYNVGVNYEIPTKSTQYSNLRLDNTSIVGSEFPLLINQSKNRDEDLTTWNRQITAGDILDFSVLSCSGIQKCSVFLRLKL